MLNFYKPNLDYIEYLQNEETSVRGFTRVPNMVDPSYNKEKFMCGIVLNIHDVDYYVPVTSYTTKKPDNILIENASGVVVSSLRFNYMVPIPKNEVTLIDISAEPDPSYKSLLAQEYAFIKNNEAAILSKANSTYKKVLFGKDLGLVHNSCDFRLLEIKCKEWEASHSS